jgi:hypothetical protein
VELPLVQMPPQHWVPVAQTSPSWMHQDEAWQRLPEHRPEQQSAPVVQGLFSVLQVVLSGVQVPMVQLPLQHSASLAQTLVSAVHAGRLQTPPVHVPEQQSEGCVHAAPTWKHPVPPAPVPPKPVPVLPVEAPPAPPVPKPTLPLPHPAASTAPVGKARTTRRIIRIG